jgi:soluble lytic murein transglycosylase
MTFLRMRKIPIFCHWILIGALLLPSFASAKKKESSKESTFSYQELSPSKKLNYLSHLIFTGNWQEALERLSETGNLKVDGKQKNRLAFTQGYLFLMGGRAKEAVSILEGLENKYTEMAPVLPYWIARAERKAGDPKKAVTTLEKSCSGPCSTPPRMAREYASSLCEAGEKAKALDLFNQLQTQGPKGTGSETLRLDRMECKMKTGDSEEAYRDLRSMFVQAPVGVPRERLQSLMGTLHRINGSLPEEFPSEDRLSRISTLKNQDRWVEAAKELKDLWPLLSASSQGSMRRDGAETFFKARSYREAAEQYEKLIQESSDLPDRRELLEKLASSFARSNQFDKAIETQNQLESASGGEGSSQRSYKIAFLLADAGRCEESKRAFQDFLDRFPKSNKRDDALWQMAWCSYQSNQYDAALSSLDQLETEFPKGNYASRAAFWRYRILEAAGRHAEAKEARQKWEAKYGDGFYERWEAKVGRGNRSQCPLAENRFLNGKSEKSDSESLSPLRGNSFSTLRELLGLGLWEDFLEFYQNQSPGGLSFGDSNEGLSEWIRYFADAEQVPPELVWAVMREESHFKPTAISGAGAMGLMQIIPQTGFEIAESLQLTEFKSEDLYQPLINVRFGTHYLAQLLKQFSRNLVQTVSAYNAGPEAVERWKSQRSSRPCDEFIEEIPYRETHNYVMKVMRSFWNYRDNLPTTDQIANQ